MSGKPKTVNAYKKRQCKPNRLVAPKFEGGGKLGEGPKYAHRSFKKKSEGVRGAKRKTGAFQGKSRLVLQNQTSFVAADILVRVEVISAGRVLEGGE